MARVVISVDSHTELLADLRPYLDPAFRDEFDAGAALALEDEKGVIDAFRPLHEGAESAESEQQRIVGGLSRRNDRKMVAEEYIEPRPIERRLREIDEDGVAAEFITPFVGAMGRPELLHACAEAYNRYFQDYTSAAPVRFSGAAAINLICGIQTAVKEVEQAFEHGLRGMVFPGKTRDVSPTLPRFNSRLYDPIWSAMHERGMAIVFHGGPGREKPALRWQGSDPGWEVLTQRDNAGGAYQMEAFAEILAGGVLERFPQIKMGVLEAGVRWIPPLLDELDAFAKAVRPTMTSYKFELLPSEQFHRQGFAVTLLDRLDVEQRHQIGIENLMWGSDYPHVEGSYPNSRSHLQSLLQDVPTPEADAILSGNAIRLLGFDRDALAITPAAMSWQ